MSAEVCASMAAVRAKARSLSAAAGVVPGGLTGDPMTSVACILAWASGRQRLQPPEPRAIKINVITAPLGPIADRPMRPHALYRASPYRDCNALWDARVRNWDS